MSFVSDLKHGDAISASPPNTMLTYWGCDVMALVGKTHPSS